MVRSEVAQLTEIQQAVYLISKLYTKVSNSVRSGPELTTEPNLQRELAMRTAILYCGSLISNSFGPLIAAGVIGGMNNSKFRSYIPNAGGEKLTC